MAERAEQPQHRLTEHRPAARVGPPAGHRGVRQHRRQHRQVRPEGLVVGQPAVPQRAAERLDQRPVRLTVRQGPADQHRDAGAFGADGELADQPRLADAGLAGDQHQTAGAGGAQLGQLLA